MGLFGSKKQSEDLLAEHKFDYIVSDCLLHPVPEKYIGDSVQVKLKPVIHSCRTLRTSTPTASGLASHMFSSTSAFSFLSVPMQPTSILRLTYSYSTNGPRSYSQLSTSISQSGYLPDVSFCRLCFLHLSGQSR